MFDQMSCCGMFEESSLEDGVRDLLYKDFPWDKPQPKRSQVDWRRATERYLTEQLSEVAPKPRLILATTVRGINPGILDGLRAKRFQVARRFRNGNSGNMVTLWWKLAR